jgi:murein L,D-transpeptidase YcbB/YkuD
MPVLRQDRDPRTPLARQGDFANDYAVYIHGTPVQSLFSLGARALSSGCVRMEQPVEMAAISAQHQELAAQPHRRGRARRRQSQPFCHPCR